MMPLPLSKGYFTIIDREDYDLAMSYGKWNIQIKPNGKKYAIGFIYNGKGNTHSTRRLHRIIMKAQSHEQVDHINGNSLDNRRCNLRITNALGNARNRAPQKRQKSKYKGVGYASNPGSKKKYWFARICRGNRKSKIIGYYSDEISAANAYDQEALKCFGSFAFLNFKDKE